MGYYVAGVLIVLGAVAAWVGFNGSAIPFISSAFGATPGQSGAEVASSGHLYGTGPADPSTPGTPTDGGAPIFNNYPSTSSLTVQA